MVMTHYMEWLALNQPINLILFMLVPMVLAETILASEIFTLFYKGAQGDTWKSIRHGVSLFLGIYFIGVIAYWFAALIPGTDYRGPIDTISVWAYVLAIIPAALLLLQELGVLGKALDERKKFLRHVALLVFFVLFTHLAMVFGMADPQLAGYVPPQPMNHHQMQMDMKDGQMNHDMSNMDSKMDHSKMDHSKMN